MSHLHTTTKKPVRHESFSPQVTETSPQIGLCQSQMNELIKMDSSRIGLALGVAYVETHMM